MNKQQYNLTKILQRAQNICSKKEVCASEIKQKLKLWQISDDDIETVVEALYTEKFIDDARFARAFVNDKFRFNKWGRLKIKMYLKQKGIAEYCIKEALENIPNEDYKNLVFNEIKNKHKNLHETDDYKMKGKLFQFASARGYEPELIYEMLERII